MLALFVLGLALGIVYPVYKSYHNRTHYTEGTCTVTNVDNKFGVSSISGKSIAIDTKECGHFEMQKTIDGKSVDEVGECVETGGKYQFQFDDYQAWHSPKRAQKFSPIR